LRERLGEPGAALDFAERFLGPFIRRFLAECVVACQDADAIFYWPPSLVGPSLAEALGIPCFAIATYPLPHCRTRAFANPWHSGGSTTNERTWAHGEPLWGRLFRDEVMAWRRTLGLREVSPALEQRRLRRLPHLLGFSSAVLPRPDDWPAAMHVTGYWFLDLASSFTPPPALLDFLAAGPPPVAIGFGSMAARDPGAMTEMVTAALRRAGLRGILLTGWGGLSQGDLPDDVFKLDAAPHDWLFPRVTAVVHHGGAGTTAAALRAGVPLVTIPFGFDQHLWGRQVHRLGAGVAPIPQAELTAERLAAALSALTADPSFRARAAALATVIRAEDGTGTAAALVDRYLGGFKRRRR
jgi:sterol 3beta-glucosyltransferase